MSEPIKLDRHHMLLYGGLVLVAVVGLMIWNEGRVDAAKLKATVEAQQKIFGDLAEQRRLHEDEDRRRAEETEKQLESMRRIVAEVKTPQQIVGWSQKQLEDAIRGIRITVPAPTPDNPNPQATVTIPEASLPQLRDTIERCKECDVKLSAAQMDLESRLAQMKAADAQIEAVKKERDGYRAQLKGGTFWTRTKRVAKWAAIFGTVGYVLGRTTK